MINDDNDLQPFLRDRYASESVPMENESVPETEAVGPMGPVAGPVKNEVVPEAGALNPCKSYTCEDVGPMGPVVGDRGGAGETQEETGAMVGVSRSRVSEIGDTSNVDSDNACIPDLRLKLPRHVRNEQNYPLSKRSYAVNLQVKNRGSSRRDRGGGEAQGRSASPGTDFFCRKSPNPLAYRCGLM